MSNQIKSSVMRIQTFNNIPVQLHEQNWSLAVLLFYIVELSLAVPITNSLTFLFTILSGWCLGDKIRHWGKYQPQNAADMFLTSHHISHEFDICVLTIEKHLHVLLDFNFKLRGLILDIFQRPTWECCWF